MFVFALSGVFAEGPRDQRVLTIGRRNAEKPESVEPDRQPAEIVGRHRARRKCEDGEREERAKAFQTHRGNRRDRGALRQRLLQETFQQLGYTHPDEASRHTPMTKV